VTPTVPAVLAVLAIRLASPLARTPGVVVGELALYVTVTALATFWVERDLLAEIRGYLRRAPAPA
jgi:hypothetical protein